MADFSCYFHVENKSSWDFHLERDEIKDGNWSDPANNPPQDIKPKQSVRFELNDKGGTSKGAEGSVFYTGVDPKSGGNPEGIVHIKLYMSCPLSGSNKAEVPEKDNAKILVSAVVGDRSGHPADGYFTIHDMNEVENKT